MIKRLYLKDTNMFILRQLNSKINTMVISMSVICLMLFMTITILSSSLALRNTMQKDLIENTPVDLNLIKYANLQEKSIKYGREKTNSKEQIEDSKISIIETLKNNKFDMEKLKDVIEIPIYVTDNLKLGSFFGSNLESVKQKFPMLKYDTKEEIVKISDYNKIARLYDIDEYTLEDNEYIVICNFKSMEALRNEVLGKGYILEIDGKEYNSKYDECKNGFIEMSGSHTNTGIILVPDSCNFKKKDEYKKILVANYNANSDEEKEEIEKEFSDNNSGLIQNLINKGIELDGSSKINIIESSVGLATIVTFIAIYLGIIFLIASSAILALKQLTDSSDNKQRYTILRKIGCDEKMINKSLFRQIGIFFMMPLLLAVIHSIFGIQFVLTILEGLASKNDLLPSIIVTIIVMGAIYGAYFMATYLGSKNIIKEEG